MARKRHLKWCDGKVAVALGFVAPKNPQHAADLDALFDEVALAYKRYAAKLHTPAADQWSTRTLAGPITAVDWHAVAQQMAEALETAEATLAALRTPSAAVVGAALVAYTENSGDAAGTFYPDELLGQAIGLAINAAVAAATETRKVPRG